MNIMKLYILALSLVMKAVACVQPLLTPPPAGEKQGESVCELLFLIVFQGQHGGPQQIFVKFSRFHAYFLNKIML
jgi:hypothetical protein